MLATGKVNYFPDEPLEPPEPPEPVVPELVFGASLDLSFATVFAPEPVDPADPVDPVDPVDPEEDSTTLVFLGFALLFEGAGEPDEPDEPDEPAEPLDVSDLRNQLNNLLNILIMPLKYLYISFFKKAKNKYNMLMAKKVIITWQASHEAVVGLTFDEDIDVSAFEKDLNENKDPRDPNGALAKIEQMTQENSIDFQNMANVQLTDFKVREI